MKKTLWLSLITAGSLFAVSACDKKEEKKEAIEAPLEIQETLEAPEEQKLAVMPDGYVEPEAAPAEEITIATPTEEVTITPKVS